MVQRPALPWALAAAFLAAVPACATPSVSTSMSAAFLSPPYLLELMYDISILLCVANDPRLEGCD